MKRSGPPRRRRALARGGPLKPVGEGKRKKMARYRAYLESPVWQAKRNDALARAGHRCEYEHNGERYTIPFTCDVIVSPGRCGERATHVHHKTYARFGGEELPEDLQALCRRHHDLIEARDFPHRSRSRRAATPARTP